MPPDGPTKQSRRRTPIRAIVIGLLVVMSLVGDWSLYRSAQARAREAERKESLRREIAAAKPALQALQSITMAGLTFRDYSPRVLDAKVQVIDHMEDRPHLAHNSAGCSTDGTEPHAKGGRS